MAGNPRLVHEVSDRIWKFEAWCAVSATNIFELTFF